MWRDSSGKVFFQRTGRQKKVNNTQEFGHQGGTQDCIAQGVGVTGTGVLQVVSDFLDPDGEFAMLREMVSTSGRPMSISTTVSSGSSSNIWIPATP